MRDDIKQQYTLRITHANRSQLTVIIYEMLLSYLEDIRTAHTASDRLEFRAGIRHATGCVDELMRALNYEYELSTGLLQLYMYVKKELILADIRNNPENLRGVQVVIEGLRAAFDEVSHQDASEPLMMNTQDVYAGLTYGRKELNESLSYQTSSRGFRA